jgi:hypothetical protein
MTGMRTRTSATLSLVVALVVAAFASACGGPPRDALQQYVARDAWDATCAEQAMIEKWQARNGRWKVEGEVWVVDVDASFKLANACTSGLPVVGKSFKQFETVTFTQTVEMSKCRNAAGDTGWALPGKESSRCWTGPTLIAR